MNAMSPRHATSKPWGYGLQHHSYGADDTYRLAAAWLKDCSTVADWGGASGYFERFLPTSTRYTLIDGTVQATELVLADLVSYREPSDGIMLRHVLDNTEHWESILANALRSFQKRMVVVTFTPDAPVTRVVKLKSAWPVRHFNPSDLMTALGDWLVRHEAVKTTHPERIYYLERRA